MPADPTALAAAQLHRAVMYGRPCPPIRNLFESADVDAAYKVQSLNLARAYAAGQRRVGRKVGLTSPAVQRQLGVDRPDFGVLLDSMLVEADTKVPPGRLLQPKVEAEVAFWLGADLDRPLESISDVRPAVASVVAAIEIVDSRVADWDITIVDTIADNASSGMFVTSTEGVPLAEVIPAEVVMHLEVNDVLASTGTGAACLGDPLYALLWLARTVQRLGVPLRAGELVLSGALGPMTAVQPGDHVRATITGLGSVEVAFAEEN